MQDPRVTIKPVLGQSKYDESFYKTHYNKTSAGHFLKYSRDIEKFVREQGWSLDFKFNRKYCTFKSGFYNVFGIMWIGTKTFALTFKLTKEEAETKKIPMTRYESQWKEAFYFVDPNKTKLSDFYPLFELAYRKRTGD